MKLSHLFVLLGAGLLNSCASYQLRRSCESTNWYDYGHSVAMKGRRLTGDDFIRKCAEVEAKVDAVALESGFKAGMTNYCTGKVAYNRGFEGQAFNLEFCDSSMKKKLLAAFKKGRTNLCQDNGFRFGASGEIYEGQCRDMDEASFLSKYRKGRYKFLRHRVESETMDLRDLERKEWQAQRELSDLDRRLQALGPATRQVVERTYDPVSKSYRTETREEEESLDAQRIRREASSAVENKEAELTAMRKKMDQLRDSISDIQRELVSLSEE